MTSSFRLVIVSAVCWLLSSSPGFAQQRVGEEFVVGQGFSNPQVITQPSGAFLVVADGISVAPGDPDIGVVGQRYDASGLPLGGPFKINTYTTNYQWNSAVATDAAGNFVAVWDSDGQDGSSRGVFGQRFDSAGVPQGAEFQVNTTTTGIQDYPDVASDAAGNFVVVWQADGQDGSLFGVFARRFNSAGTPLGGEFQVNTYTTGDQNIPLVSSASTGSFTVVWSSGHDGSGGGVFGQRYDSAGTPQGGEFQVNTNTAGNQTIRSIATDGAGNVIIVWNDFSGFDLSGVFARRYDSAGAPLGGVFQVNTYGVGNQILGHVTTDPTGGFIIVWASEGQNGDGYSVFGRRYDSTATPLDLEFLVNTSTSGIEWFPTVAATSASTWVVVWNGTNQSLGQRYVAGSPVGVCAPTPQPCRTPAVGQKAKVLLKDKIQATSDKLVWKWLKGAATTKGEFGNPLSTDDYQLCVYGGSDLRATLNARAGGLCGATPCWTEKPNGFLYRDKTVSLNGIAQIKLQEGLDEQAKIQVKAQKANLPLPAPLSLTSPLTVQLENLSSGLCWGAQYSFPPVTKRTAEVFKDKAD